MKISEAKEYFCALGNLHAATKKDDPLQARGFLEAERSLPQYAEALQTLLFENDVQFVRKVDEETVILSEKANAVLASTENTILGSLSKRARIAKFARENALMTDLTQEIKREFSDDPSYTVRDMLLLCTALHQKETQEQLQNAIKEFADGSALDQGVEGLCYRTTGMLDIKIGGVSLLDFARQDFRKKKIDPDVIGSYIAFFMKFSEPYEQRIADIHKQNNEGLSVEYPYIMRYNIIRLSEYRYVLLVADNAFVSNATADFPVPSAVKDKAYHMVGQIDKFRTIVYTMLFDSENPNSLQLQEQYRKYLSSDRRSERVMALTTMVNLTSREKTIELYRSAVARGRTSSFHALLAKKIESMFEGDDPIYDIARVEDMDDIVENGALQHTISVPSPKELKHTIETMGNAFLKVDDVSELPLSWQELGLKKPASVQLSFPTGSKFLFTLSLHYEGDLGETFDVTTVFNVKKNTFEWSMLESPEEHTAQRNLFIRLGAQVLAELSRQAAAQRVQPVQMQRERFYETREKVEKPKKTRVVGIPVHGKKIEEHSLHDYIDVDVDALRAELQAQGIPSTDQALILQKIVDINEGKGSVKKMTSAKTVDGKPLYKSRAGDYRIKVVSAKEAAQKGKRTFTVYQIKHRREAYR